MKVMKRKRLNRDGWGFQHYPYCQMRIDHASFHELACLIRLTDGDKKYQFENPRAAHFSAAQSASCRPLLNAPSAR